MDSIDYNICDYLFFSNRIFELDKVDRDYDMECKIIELGKLDYILYGEKNVISRSSKSVSNNGDYDHLLKPLANELSRVHSWARAKNISIETARQDLRELFNEEVSVKDFAETHKVNELKINDIHIVITSRYERSSKALMVYL